MHIPACCLTCGYVFQSGIVVDFSTNFSSRGSYSTCPRCGGNGLIPEGVMQIFGRVVRLASGPDFTKEMFEAIGAVVEDLRQGKTSMPQAFQSVQKVSPDAAKEFREWATLGINFLLLIVTIIGLIVAWKSIPQSNTPAEMVAEEAVDSYLCSGKPQFDYRASPAQSLRQQGDVRPLVIEQFKNRQQRRAEAAKARCQKNGKKKNK